MRRAGWKLLKVLVAFIVPVVMLGIWFWIYHVKGESNSFVASPPQVWATLVSDWPEISDNTWRSLLRLLAGVSLGVVLGTISGITLARVASLRAMFAPTLQVLTAIPFMVHIPFFLMAFGFGDFFRVSLITACTFLLVNAQAFHAVRQLNPDYFELASIYEKSGWQLIWQVLVPASLPAVVVALRSSLLFGWLAVALAERASAVWPKGGLGYYILRAREQGQFTNMFAGVIVLAVLAFALDWLVGRLQRWVSHWCDTSEAVQDKEALG